ncbi:plastocyanin/azurin family copper-binding protein [Streptomyces diastatochromogenes]|uniref:plastocyanin/azurin family copper-binding protein n=1 Tax=Streptomyces diastatochromogenes TaxID=42236 RepID=UPI0036622381
MAIPAISAHTTRTALRTTAGAFCAALVLAACSSGGGGQASGSAGTTQAASGTRVTVTESEFMLKLSRTSFTPGTYTFVAHNAGKITHALSIDGPGVEDARTKDIPAGHSATVTVTLKKGTYDVYCPVDSHQQMGMDQHIKAG